MRVREAMRSAWLLALPILLANCAGTGAGSDVCLAWKPILIDTQDELSEPTARQILAHNQAGRKLCGW